MALHPLAGKPAPADGLVNVPRLVTAYYTREPDPTQAGQRVAFGTSGHRGSAYQQSFNENHIAAICQAIAEHRAAAGVSGPLFVGMDTHALSEPALITAVEVLAANGVALVLQPGLGYVPTPVVSHAILAHNRGRSAGLADGVVITPSHNPPEDGGFKYNATHGGPADTDVTAAIEQRANQLLEAGPAGVRRISWARAQQLESTRMSDMVSDYVEDLGQAIDMQAISGAALSIGVDPLGGSSLACWDRIAHRWGVHLEVVNTRVDPAFGFMPLDKDGRIRMDCSSPWAMAGLLALRERFDVAFAADPDADRHGIVTRHAGLMNPNHYLAVAIAYLLGHRPAWAAGVGVGKTLVSSALIDRVVADLGRRLVEVPVGFKWFVPGLHDASLCFGGEESAGASFLRRDGTCWTTDKDGLLLGLLAAEIMAITGRDPAEHDAELQQRLGSPSYERLDAPATPAQKRVLAALSPEHVSARELAGEPIRAALTRAPGNQAPIGGLKVVADNGWFAARPSGTEDVYKIYAESFQGKEHLARIQAEAQAIVAAAFRAAGV